jgi:acetylornithine deacetylase
MLTKEELAHQLTQWLAIDSVTPTEGPFLETLEPFFQARGWITSRQHVEDGRWNLLATRPGHAPRLVFSTHVDTVPPHLPVRRDGDTIYGRGACDTKGGLLAMCEAAERLLQLGHHDLGFLLVVGEEVDHIGAKTAQALDVRPQRIILCEPTRNRVIAAQKGMAKLKLHAHGTAAHSAYPERGDSALHRLIDAAHDALHADWPSHELLGPTTLNIGTMQGGIAANVFAPEANADVLIRLVSEPEPVLEQLRRLCAHHRVEVEPLVHNAPVFFAPPDGFVSGTVSFNTDASYLAPLSPVWLVGPGDIEVAHTDHEHITLQDILDGVDLYVRLALTVLDPA